MEDRGGSFVSTIVRPMIDGMFLLMGREYSRPIIVAASLVDGCGEVDVDTQLESIIAAEEDRTIEDGAS